MIQKLLPLVLLGALVPCSADAQRGRDVEGLPLNTTVWGGFSWRSTADGFRIAEDMRSVAVRVSLRLETIRPWVQADWYDRPGYECFQIPGVACNPDGWIARAGLTVPLSVDQSERGLHPHLAGGLGAAFSTETELTYLLGFGLTWTILPALAPRFELRYEQVPGLNAVVMSAFGVRLGLP